MELDGVTLLVGLAALVLGPGGAAWVGVKIGLNGVKADVAEIKGDMKHVHQRITRNSENIARIDGGQS